MLPTPAYLSAVTDSEKKLTWGQVVSTARDVLDALDGDDDDRQLPAPPAQQPAQTSSLPSWALPAGLVALAGVAALMMGRR